MQKSKSFDFLINKYKKMREVFRPGIFIPLFIIILTSIFALLTWSQNNAHFDTILNKALSENQIRMEYTIDHIEEYFSDIYSDLHFISMDSNVKQMKSGSELLIQSLYDYQWNTNELTEIYIIERDFDGTKPPFMAFEYGMRGRTKKELHSYERELEEYSIQMGHIQQFIADPTLKALVSDEISLCASNPDGSRASGIVYSIPIYNENELNGIIAAMIPTYRLNMELERGNLGNMAILVGENTKCFGCEDLPQSTSTWFSQKFADNNVSAYFEGIEVSFKVNEWSSIWSSINIVSSQRWWIIFQYNEQDYLKGAYGSAISRFWIFILVAGLILSYFTYLLFKRFEDKIKILDEHKIIKSALVNSEEQYRILVEQTTNLITKVDNKGKFTYVNAISQKILGLSPEKCKGKLAFDFIHPEDKEKTRQWFDDWQKTKQKYNTIENRQINVKTGEITYMLWSCTMRYSKDGNMKGLDAIARDISDRYELEQKLIQSERKVNAWVKNSPVCTKVVDLDFNLQFMSEAGVRDLKIDDITVYYGTPYPLNFYPDSFKNPMRDNLREAKKTGKIITQEAYVLDLDGNELWYHSTIVPVFDESGNLDYFMVVSSEITERKHAEIALRESQTRFRHLFDDMGDAVFVTHFDSTNTGLIIEANPAASAQTGYDKNELVNMNISTDLTVRGSGEIPFEEFEEKLNNGQTVTSRELKKRKDGSEYWVEVVVTPVHYQGKKACISINRDITDRKHEEDALKSIAVSFSSVTGEEFFNSISKYLVETLDVNMAFIGELVGDDTVKVIGGVHNGELIGPLKYELKDTPCENVFKQDECCYPVNVANLFPKDLMLKDLGMEGYLGSPIKNRLGQTIGIFVILSESPILNQPTASSIFKIFIDRVSAEMQRAIDGKTIKDNELKFRDIFENSMDSICILDADGNFIDVNKSTCLLTEYTNSELLRMNLSDVVHPESKNKSLRALHDQKTSGYYELYEGSIITKSGKTKYVEINSNSKYDNDGKFIGSRDFIRDVTKRQQLDRLKTVLMEIATVANSDFELSELIKSIREIVNTIIDTTHFHIGLYDKINETISEPYSKKNPESASSLLNRNSLADYVIKSGESVFADEKFCLDLKKTGKIESFDKDCKLWLGVPLVAMDDVIGILVVKSYSDAKAYNVDDLNILKHISIEIGAVIHRKQTENELLNSREQFKLLMQETPYVVEIYDIDGLQIDVNKAYETLWGFPAEATVNKFNVLKSNEVKESGLIKYVDQAYAGEAVSVPEYEFNSTGKTEANGLGRVRWLNTHIFPLKTTSGKIKNIVITHEDITERRFAEISLMRSENLLKESQNVARIGSYILDITSDQWQSSDVLDEIFGIDENFQKDTSGWLKLIHADERDMMMNYFNSCIKRKESFNKEYRIQRNIDQKELWVHGLGKLKFDKKGNPIEMIGTIQDISIRKEFEIEKNALEHHLQKSQKLETIGTLAGGITHEINQPLNAISISANSVLYWHRKNPEVLPELFVEELHQISKATKRIDEIIRHMRSFWVSDSAVKMENNSIKHVMMNALSLMEQQFYAHGIIIEKKFSDQDITILSEKVSLDQIIINLLINAMHSLDESGQTNKKVILQTQTKKSSCILSISDNGVGIPEGKEMTVFSPFYSTKDPESSSGLGLAIVKNLVMKMNGSISATNNKSGGARFTVTIPLKEEIV